MSELIDRLKIAGIRAVPSIQKSGRLNGMSYVIDGMLIKGSDLGRAYTAQGLQRRLGIQYDPHRDEPSLLAAAERATDKDIARFRDPDRVREIDRDKLRDRSRRLLQYDGLSTSQRAVLREIGRFRTVSAQDLIRIQYAGDRRAWRQDMAALVAQKLLEERSIVVATHSKSHGKTVKSMTVLALTKSGKNLVRRCDPVARASHQAIYAGIVKPREVAHDAAIYRMYEVEAGKIRTQGGRIKRVVLDFELKKRVYTPLAKVQRQSPKDYTRAHTRIAQENGLKVIQGKIRFPDLRIEYETAAGEATRVDLELATEHYRGDHMAAKQKAGFKIYADSASSPGGGYGRSSPFDPDHMAEIFSL
jgi:DNA-binding MarR family transcriptional regulator